MKRKQRQEKNEIKSIEVKGRTFANVKNISKFKRCTPSNCNYYFNCKENGVVRLFDCTANANNIIGKYSFFTGIMVLSIVLFFFYILKLSLLKTIAFTILSVVAFDMLCTAFEVSIFKIRENMLYKKLIKIEKKKEEEKSFEKVAERLKKVYGEDINLAKTSIQSLKKILNNENFLKSKHEEALNNLQNIIVVVEKNPILYSKVAYLFEVQVPEFYNTLKVYEILFEKGVELPTSAEILAEYINKFYETTEKLKIDITNKEKDE